MRKNKLSLLLCLLILFFSSLPVVNSQLNPIAVSGWVYMQSGVPASGASVSVFNIDTGQYANTTANLNGQYVVAMSGANGDIIRISCSHLGEAGVNTTVVNLADPTQWLDLHLLLTAVPPVALFTYKQYDANDVETPYGQVVKFRDESSDADGHIDSWTWDFGDNGRSDEENPQHTYVADGSYRVVLTVRDDDGLGDSFGRSIIIVVNYANNVSIPKPQPSIYPGFTVPEMYDLLRVSDLPSSDDKLIIVIIDSGMTPRIYDGIDLSKIQEYHHSVYSNGLDEHGHGTFISYEIGYIVQTKIPNAVIISYKLFDKNGQCLPEQFMQALDAVKAFHPDIVSVSAGKVGTPDDQFSKKVDELRSSGIIVVSTAAGNNGPRASTILSPACSDSAIAVVASNPRWADDVVERREKILNLSDDVICPWSSRGPVSDLFKPDVASPGESIIGPWLKGEKTMSGTSMSAPLITGGTAVVIANNKLLVEIVRALYFWNGGTVANAYEDALKEGCYAKGEQNTWGAGIPVFTKVDELFRAKLIMLIIMALITILIVSLTMLSVYLYTRRRRRQKRENQRQNQ
jgi:PKD repeat protein